jgi:hypothetical protein
LNLDVSMTLPNAMGVDRLDPMGRSLHCQVDHHVRTKFATPILHAKDNFKFYNIFSTYKLPLIVYFYIYLNFLVIFIFVVTF